MYVSPVRPFEPRADFELTRVPIGEPCVSSCLTIPWHPAGLSLTADHLLCSQTRQQFTVQEQLLNRATLVLNCFLPIEPFKLITVAKHRYPQKYPAYTRFEHPLFNCLRLRGPKSSDLGTLCTSFMTFCRSHDSHSSIPIQVFYPASILLPYYVISQRESMRWWCLCLGDPILVANSCLVHKCRIWQLFFEY